MHFNPDTWVEDFNDLIAGIKQCRYEKILESVGLLEQNRIVLEESEVLWLQSTLSRGIPTLIALARLGEWKAANAVWEIIRCSQQESSSWLGDGLAYEDFETDPEEMAELHLRPIDDKRDAAIIMARIGNFDLFVEVDTVISGRAEYWDHFELDKDEWEDLRCHYWVFQAIDTEDPKLAKLAWNYLNDNFGRFNLEQPEDHADYNQLQKLAGID